MLLIKLNGQASLSMALVCSRSCLERCECRGLAEVAINQQTLLGENFWKLSKGISEEKNSCPQSPSNLFVVST